MSCNVDHRDGRGNPIPCPDDHLPLMTTDDTRPLNEDAYAKAWERGYRRGERETARTLDAERTRHAALVAAARDLIAATDTLSEWDEFHGYIVNSERDGLDHDVDAAWDAIRFALDGEPR